MCHVSGADSDRQRRVVAADLYTGHSWSLRGQYLLTGSRGECWVPEWASGWVWWLLGYHYVEEEKA